MQRALNKGHLPFIAEEKGVWRGRTDGDGRTPIFALPFRPRANDVRLLRRVGDGPFGEQFQLVNAAGEVVSGMPYRMLVCTDPPQAYVGRTNANGYTVYAASNCPLPVGVATDGDILSEQGKDFSGKDRAYCQGEAREVTGQAEVIPDLSKTEKGQAH